MSYTTERPAWRCRVTRRFGPLLLVCLAACASKQPPKPAAARKPPAPQRLAWMPLDPLDVPTVARALNDEMSRVKVAGATTSVKAAVSMEVAQLAIECIQPTPDCYAAVGRSLGADRLMWAELEAASAPEEKIRVTVVTFDVRSGTAPRRVGETFGDAQAARAGAAGLVGRAADSGSRSP